MFSWLKERLFKIIFILVLLMGCFWQMVKVCESYFNYPTNVFIETTVDPYSKPLPALTLCTNDGAMWGRNSSEVFELKSNKFKYEMIKDIVIRGEGGGVTRSLLDHYINNAIERISFDYYCITFNSMLAG